MVDLGAILRYNGDMELVRAFVSLECEMYPVNFRGANKVLTSPSDWDEEKYGVCRILHVKCENGVHKSCWKFSFREWIKLIWKRKIYLYVASSVSNPFPTGIELD